jgi:uncharacterized phage-associated protein
MENDEKLKELSLFIAEQSKEDPSFGATKLNKILFVADFFFYGNTGRAITGADYVHRNNGPVPRRMPAIIESLQTEGRARIESTAFFGYRQKKLVPLTGSNTSIFTEDELSFVSDVIAQFRPYNGTQLSDWTHSLSPWLVTEDGDQIPYHAIFVMHKLPVERAAMKWAQSELQIVNESAA